MLVGMTAENGNRGHRAVDRDTARNVLDDIDTLMVGLEPHTRVPVVMGAVLKNHQIAENYYEFNGDLIRVTVTVAPKPPHVA